MPKPFSINNSPPATIPTKKSQDCNAGVSAFFVDILHCTNKFILEQRKILSGEKAFGSRCNFEGLKKS
jgi:hypothetical protein